MSCPFIMPRPIRPATFLSALSSIALRFCYRRNEIGTRIMASADIFFARITQTDNESNAGLH